MLLLQGVLRKSRLLKSQSQRFTILDTMNTVLQPGRFTLLLGPPGAGKSTLLKALAGRFHKSTSVDVSLTEAVSMLPSRKKTLRKGVARRFL